MISLTSAQLNAWIVMLIYPLSRILAFIAIAPIWSTAAIPRRTRLILGLGITIAILPALPEMPKIDPGSTVGLALLFQQVFIGLSMGFAARVVMAAIDLAGEFIGLQMGLGFATFYDPLNSTQTPVIAEMLGLVSLLLFLSLDGHLLYISTLLHSFTTLPIGLTGFGMDSWLAIVELGGKIFSAGLMLALPIVVALMITNVGLAVLTRAAPQLNLFALGFPITMLVGFGSLAVAMNYLAEPLQQLYRFAFAAIENFPVNIR